jgi:DNA-binding Lrp family transcriptional regulator
MSMKACIPGRIVTGKAKEALKEIRKIAGVEKAYLVFGRYDLVAFIKVADYETLKETTGKINAIESFRSTETLVEA